MDSARKLGAHSRESLRNTSSQARLVPARPSRLYYFVDTCISRAQTHEIAWISGKAPSPKHKQGHQLAARLLRQGTSAVSSVNPSRTQESASSASYSLMLNILFEVRAERQRQSKRVYRNARRKARPLPAPLYVQILQRQKKRKAAGRNPV